MNDAEMIVSVVAMGCVTGMFVTYFKSKAKQAVADQSPRIDALEARIRALEATVSDPENKLRDQFRDLERG